MLIGKNLLTSLSLLLQLLNIRKNRVRRIRRVIAVAYGCVWRNRIRVPPQGDVRWRITLRAYALRLKEIYAGIIDGLGCREG
jgi:hypothetical protein